jgi:hypothetical protein
VISEKAQTVKELDGYKKVVNELESTIKSLKTLLIQEQEEKGNAVINQ